MFFKVPRRKPQLCHWPIALENTTLHVSHTPPSARVSMPIMTNRRGPKRVVRTNKINIFRQYSC